MGFSPGTMVKNLPADARDIGDLGLIHGLGRFPGGGNSNPLQYSCLEEFLPGKFHGQKSKGVSRVAQVIKNLPAMQDTQVQSLGPEDLWRRAWQPIPVFLPGEFHGQRSLVGYSPWTLKELDTTE